MRTQPAGCTILCVDDHELGLKLRKQVLEMAGYTVLIAKRAHEALELFRGNHVDLVLAEHVAPAIIGGPTLAATMKMLKPEVPVAILSTDLQASPEDGRYADRFMTKLVPVRELLRMIRSLLRRRTVPYLSITA